MKLRHVMSFLDLKYPNPIQTENYGYLIGILIIDRNRSGSEENQPKSDQTYKYLDPHI